MKIVITAAAAIALTASGAPALGQNSQGAGPQKSQGTAVLMKALHSIQNTATPPGQDKRPADPDQGDDNAALRAITEVCTKSTPAADRSAICPREPESPQ